MNSQTKESSLKSMVRNYIRLGYAPIPVPDGQKAPELRGWPKLRIAEGQVGDYFSELGNVGLLLGKPSGGLTDVDIDAPEAAAVADVFLPPTEMIHGRKSRPPSHRYYLVESPLAPLKLTDVDGSSLVEIRSTGQ